MLLQYLGKQKNENCVFHLNAECCFANRHTKCIHIITWSRLNHSSFSQESTVCTKQDPGSEYSMLPSVTTHSSFTKSWCQSLCQKWEFFFVEPQVKSQWIALVGYPTISTNVSCYQTRCRQQYYLPFGNTAHAPVHDARNTVQQLLRKTLNFISPELYGPKRT